MTEREFYNLLEIVKLTGVNVQTLRKWIKAGTLQAKKTGRAYYVSKDNFKKCFAG